MTVGGDLGVNRRPESGDFDPDELDTRDEYNKVNFNTLVQYSMSML